MSTQHEGGGAAHGLRATEEATAGVNVRAIIGVGVASIVIFAASVWVAYVLLKRDTRTLRAEQGEARPAKELVGAAEVGIVDNIHFDEDHRLATWRAEMLRKATSYSWADRSKGLVRIPIAQAMQKVVQDNRHDAAELQPLPWPTAPQAPGTLDIVIRNLKPGQPAAPSPTPRGKGTP